MPVVPDGTRNLLSSPPVLLLPNSLRLSGARSGAE